ncbi:MAG: hypothetical protein K2J12_09490 [Muribaculaceae bacterium]|nr:hypothetical protein [Muribaculaceae bacterium]
MKYLTLTLMMLLTLSSCGLMYDTDECPASDSGSVSLSFSMQSAGALLYSRDDYDSEGHTEVNSEFRYFEDGIDMSDLAVFVFAKISGTSNPEKLVYKLTDLTKSDDARIKIVGSPGNYLVEVMIFREDLKEVLEYEITPEGNENISFRMLMLANCSSPGTDAQAKWDQIDGKDSETVIKQLNGWNFAMSYIYNKNAQSDDVADIYKNRKDHVPMFGNVLFEPVSEDALYYSRPENRVYLGEMSLLRALAKVRVVDNIPEKIGGYPMISSVVFYSSQDLAHQLPVNALEYENGQQVHTPNIAQPDNVLDIATAKPFRLGVVPDALSMTPADKHTGKVFIGFVPEQPIYDAMPLFRITIANKNADDANKIDTYVYDVPMTTYNGKKFEFGDNILRNHIYTLSVNNFGTKLELKVDLTPYTGVNLDPTFGF